MSHSEDMADKPSYFYVQSGVIPFRRSTSGLDVLLISSRGRRRWLAPKGIVELGMDAGESAAKEAFEEAGVGGTVHGQALGKYQYKKWGGVCEVEVFPMEVEVVLEDWPEKSFRRRQWFPVDEAAGLVREDGLRALMQRLKARIVEPHE